MRLPLILMLPLIIIGVLADWYICRTVRRRYGSGFLYKLNLIFSVGMNLGLVLICLVPKKSVGDGDITMLMWALFAYLSIYLAKFIAVLFDLISRIPTIWHGKRIKLIGVTGAIIALVVTAMMWFGAWNARKNIEVRSVEIIDRSLPSSFNGLRVVQISDMHLGTYGDDTTFINNLIEKVNGLRPDIIFFTGDIVNRHTTEILPFVNTLSQLYAPEGVYSVLGNHDYGDYYNWESPEEKQENQRLLAQIQQSMGWHLLNNRTVFLKAGSDSIAIIGVENIGDPPFPVYGNLDEAYPGNLSDDTFKILLSHNPAHWENDIENSPDKNIALTLSGHTHAMQMELFGKSPAVWRYRCWGGLYDDESDKHKLYVNIGTGEVGFPARIGATPEITLFTFSDGH